MKLCCARDLWLGVCEGCFVKTSLFQATWGGEMHGVVFREQLARWQLSIVQWNHICTREMHSLRKHVNKPRLKVEGQCCCYWPEWRRRRCSVRTWWWPPGRSARWAPGTRTWTTSWIMIIHMEFLLAMLCLVFPQNHPILYCLLSHPARPLVLLYILYNLSRIYWLAAIGIFSTPWAGLALAR